MIREEDFPDPDTTGRRIPDPLGYSPTAGYPPSVNAAGYHVRAALIVQITTATRPAASFETLRTARIQQDKWPSRRTIAWFHDTNRIRCRSRPAVHPGKRRTELRLPSASRQRHSPWGQRCRKCSRFCCLSSPFNVPGRRGRVPFFPFPRARAPADAVCAAAPDRFVSFHRPPARLLSLCLAYPAVCL